MKVLILTGKFGMGHYSVSSTLKESISDRFENAEVSVVDFFEYAIPHQYKALYKSFDILVKNGKSLYSFFRRLADVADKNKSGEKAKNIPIFSKKTEELISEYNPDVVISTFPICSQMISTYKAQKGSSLPLVTCITDISSKYEWIAKNTNSYLVPSESVKEELISKGIDESKIQIMGIPVKNVFTQNHEVSLDVDGCVDGRQNSADIVCKTSFDDKPSSVTASKVKEILIMGGGLGLIPRSMSFYRAFDSLEGVKTTVITGKNHKMYLNLKSSFENIEVISYTNEVDKFMERADLIVTKPGGITLFETIYSCTPIAAFYPELPNEVQNVKFIEDNEIGISLSRGEREILEDIKGLIYDDEALELYGMNMKMLQGEFDQDALVDILRDLDSKKLSYKSELMDSRDLSNGSELTNSWELSNRRLSQDCCDVNYDERKIGCFCDNGRSVDDLGCLIEGCAIDDVGYLIKGRSIDDISYTMKGSEVYAR